MLGQPQSQDPELQVHYDKSMIIFHPDQLKQFNGFVHRSWRSRRKMCFFAGDRQGGPVIQGSYTDYEVDYIFSTQYRFSKFEDERCVSEGSMKYGGWRITVVWYDFYLD